MNNGEASLFSTDRMKVCWMRGQVGWVEHSEVRRLVDAPLSFAWCQQEHHPERKTHAGFLLRAFQLTTYETRTPLYGEQRSLLHHPPGGR